MSTFDRALVIAITAHAGQLDKAGEPYILHVMRVVLGVQTSEERIVAALHDVVEDCPDWPLDVLDLEGFGPDIIAAVDALTHRKDEDYSAFVERAGSLLLSRAVKIADLRDNLSMARRASLPDKLLERYTSALVQLECTA